MKAIITLVKFVVMLLVSILAAGINAGGVCNEEDTVDSFGSHSDNTDWGAHLISFCTFWLYTPILSSIKVSYL